jgi:putative tricarboxylic transport membrane protein
MEAAKPAGAIKRSGRGELAIAVGVIGLALVIYWQVQVMPASPIYSKVGPTLVPTLAAFGLLGLGCALLVSALRGGWQTDEEAASVPDRAALAWVAAGLALNVLLIGVAGFTIASTLLFLCVARGFGSRRIVRDAGIGFTFAMIAYFGFAKTLGINIGAGWVENAIDGLLPFTRKS